MITAAGMPLYFAHQLGLPLASVQPQSDPLCRTRGTLLIVPAAPASNMEDKGSLDASWSDSTCMRPDESDLS